MIIIFFWNISMDAYGAAEIRTFATELWRTYSYTMRERELCHWMPRTLIGHYCHGMRKFGHYYWTPRVRPPNLDICHWMPSQRTARSSRSDDHHHATGCSARGPPPHPGRGTASLHARGVSQCNLALPSNSQRDGTLCELGDLLCL